MHDCDFFVVGFNQTDLDSMEQTVSFLLANAKISGIPDFEARMGQGFSQ